MPTWLENMVHKMCPRGSLNDKKCALWVGTMLNRAEGQNTILPPPLPSRGFN